MTTVSREKLKPQSLIQLASIKSARLCRANARARWHAGAQNNPIEQRLCLALSSVRSAAYHGGSELEMQQLRKQSLPRAGFYANHKRLAFKTARMHGSTCRSGYPCDLPPPGAWGMSDVSAAGDGAALTGRPGGVKAA